jgi:DNA polymerase II large subunit
MAKDCSPEMEKYFKSIDNTLTKCYTLAGEARKKGLDPEEEAPIPVAKNMAERVVGLISVVAPQVVGTSIPERIKELEKQYGMLDWRVALVISEEVAKEKFCKFKDKLEAMEIGIRVGFSYLTLGIVSAPLEGFVGLKIKKRYDGKEYFAIQYAGPIRAAGGTGASLSVILADYIRIKMGYSTYDPDEKEINRYNAEIHDYHERVSNLQYHPSDAEMKFLVSHLPVEVDGDQTEKIEVSNYKDLPRIETNCIRGGVALVLGEGLSQKSPKLWKNLSKWGKDFGLEWDWLKEFLELKEKIHSGAGKDKKDDKKKDGKEEKKVIANNTFIMDLVAGRPILTHPLAVGGFRLRYGRGRTCGMYAVGMHPATLIVLDKFIAVGTQLKVERPRKGASVTACDTIDGPIVRLVDGSVLQLNSEEEAKSINKNVEEILFLGDIMFNYGDFSESGHSLVPVGYCPEWWELEVEKSINNLYNENSIKKSAELLELEEKRLNELLKYPLKEFPSWEEALKISLKLKVPLHPEYIFYWKLVSGEDLLLLREGLSKGKIKIDEKGIKKIILPYYLESKEHQSTKEILDKLGVSHQVVGKENIIIERKEANIFAFCFDFEDQKGLETINLNTDEVKHKDGLEIINFISKVEIRDKAGTFIGARMGRPEKAKMRKMKGSPHSMFPVGEEGDRFRCFQAAMKNGKVRSAFSLFHCKKCDKESVYPRCPECNDKCNEKYFCRFCGELDKPECRHGEANNYKEIDLDINYYMKKAQELVGEKVLPDMIKGVKGTSNKNHIPEHLAKGILRAKHNIYVNKDGTTRFDASELPITHFKPKEVHTSIEKLKKLGYTVDINDKELVEENQILEIKPQDIILPGYESLEDSATKVMTNVAAFVDNLLVKFYKLKPYYKIKKPEDLVGHLVIGLAPHISGGTVGRIIGHSLTQSLLAHPMYHAAMRRDCDGDEACILLLMDALLNFSRKYLPERRGAKTMDAPLVLTSRIYPSEVDDQVLEMDTVWKYPLELYEAAQKMKMPWEVKDSEGKKIEQLGARLETPLQYEKIGYTHDVDNLNSANLCSMYKTLPTMEDKLIGQMEIAKKVRAVDMDDVAKLVIQKHFLKDIKGNLRKFSMQQFRCVGCNAKFRRPPLINKCTECGGKVIFTISEGSVVKYLGPSLLLAEKYDFSPYLKQTLEILKRNVESIFGREKDKQVGLGTFMG